MEKNLIVLIGFIIFSKISCDEPKYLDFPKSIRLGVATSAFQIEGAWNASGKGVSNWDWWTHTCPECITDHNNIDDTCKSYYKYKEDVALIKSIGFDYYRFSVSWPRILPTGFTNVVNEEALQYYRNLTDELLANGIQPVMTIYHFDHPQLLEDMGGWTNDLMIDWYTAYAELIFKEFGPKIKVFTTINEPLIACRGYRDKSMSPGKLLLGVGYYLCVHNMLKAHAKAYRLYDAKFRQPDSKIGIIIPCDGHVLDDNNDTVSADRDFQFNCGLIGHPIMKGDYPPFVKERLALVSKAQGYSKSRLPEFSPEWISYIKGTADYFGVNHYYSRICSPDPDEAPGKYNSESGIKINFGRDIGPQGFGNLLRKIKDEYDNPPVCVFENGLADGGGIEDYGRIKYFYSYLQEMLKAINRDNCRVIYYSVWSLLDNFELSYGFSQRYGIVQVDFNSTNRERTPKLSSYWWQRVLQTRKLQDIPRE